MKNQRKKGIVGGVGFAMVALAMAGTPAFAADPAADSTAVSDDLAGAKPSVTEMTHATVTVTKINKGTRHLTVKKPDGGRQTFQVPPEIAIVRQAQGGRQDRHRLRRADRGAGPAGGNQAERVRGDGRGARDGRPDREGLRRGRGRRPDDQPRHVQGTGRRHETVAVQDPALRQKLPSLEPGQVVQLTFTQAIVGAIQPHGVKK